MRSGIDRSTAQGRAETFAEGWSNKMINLPLYLVIAYRYGNRHGHHYPIGVFTNKTQAIEEAQDYHYFRGGKYEHIIFEVNKLGFNDKIKEVWKSNGMK